MLKWVILYVNSCIKCDCEKGIVSKLMLLDVIEGRK